VFCAGQQVGGSLAKVVYFTRSTEPPSSPSIAATAGSSAHSDFSTPSTPSPIHSPAEEHHPKRVTGALTPLVLDVANGNGSGGNNGHHHHSSLSDGMGGLTGLHDERLLHEAIFRQASLQHFPGGSLNFERFETDNSEECVTFIQSLIERSAELNGVSIEEMRKGVKIMATGGGAHRFFELFSDDLHVEVQREDEMECLIEGLKFITLIPDEVYYFSDELVHQVSRHTHALLSSAALPNAEGASALIASSSNPLNPNEILERPSPDPPKFGVTFEANPTPQLPCLLVNIGSGVSIIKVDADGSFERISGTSLGGGTLWGLLSLLTPANGFDEMLALSEKGDNEAVDMLVKDIYGQDYSKLGLKSTMIASSFGKVFKKGGEKRTFRPEDISKSLLYAISNNIGQIAYMNAEKFNLNKIYFGGFFIRGHASTIATLSYAIRFWSKGTKRALFLRHEGFLGALGAWIKNMEPAVRDALED